jgi:hypothetical protein
MVLLLGNTPISVGVVPPELPRDWQVHHQAGKLNFGPEDLAALQACLHPAAGSPALPLHRTVSHGIGVGARFGVRLKDGQVLSVRHNENGPLELCLQDATTQDIVAKLRRYIFVVCCYKPSGNGRRDVKTRHVGNGMREDDSVRKDASRREYPETTRIGGC